MSLNTSPLSGSKSTSSSLPKLTKLGGGLSKSGSTLPKLGSSGLKSLTLPKKKDAFPEANSEKEALKPDETPVAKEAEKQGKMLNIGVCNRYHKSVSVLQWQYPTLYHTKVKIAIPISIIYRFFGYVFCFLSFSRFRCLSCLCAYTARQSCHGDIWICLHSYD